MSAQWTVGAWTMHEPGSGRPKTEGTFHHKRWRGSFPACRPKGKRRLWGEHSDDVAETTSHFIRFQGDRFRIKTGLEYDTGSRPHTSRCSLWGLTVSIAISLVCLALSYVQIQLSRISPPLFFYFWCFLPMNTQISFNVLVHWPCLRWWNAYSVSNLFYVSQLKCVKMCVSNLKLQLKKGFSPYSHVTFCKVFHLVPSTIQI